MIEKPTYYSKSRTRYFRLLKIYCADSSMRSEFFSDRRVFLLLFGIEMAKDKSNDNLRTCGTLQSIIHTVDAQKQRETTTE